MPERYNFEDLHFAIQNALGWEDCHLHKFEMINPKTCQKDIISMLGDGDENFDDHVPENKAKIAKYFLFPKDKAIYEYDFGDGWKHEELYKISKLFINIEEFHGKTARGVKQELYSHMLLINLARFFEFEAKNLLPPYEKNESDVKNALDYNNIFNPITMLNINFKNCLLVVGRYLENVILEGWELLGEWLPKITSSISRIRQKIRPNRHYPRISHKPADKWSTYCNLRGIKA